MGEATSEIRADIGAHARRDGGHGPGPRVQTHVKSARVTRSREEGRVVGATPDGDQAKEGATRP